MNFRSALYAGSVHHRRLWPKVHALRYRVFWLLIDLDEVGDLHRKLPFFSYNRTNLVSFRDRDHGDGSGTPLRAQVEKILCEAGIERDGGSIRLFCLPRILGYAFNPLSVYFCYRADGSLAATLYEVHNTFGERHSYLFPAGEDGAVSQHCAKAFHVSPFLDMQMAYRFRVTPPASRIAISIRGTSHDKPVIVASLAGERKALHAWNLMGAVLQFPLVTFKVTAAIHWHALRLWLKGIAIRGKPEAPAHPVTFVRKEG